MKLVPAILVAASSAFLCAQAPIMWSPGIKTALDGFEKGDYLKSSDTLTALAFAPDGTVRDRMAFAVWTQFNPFLTNEPDVKAMTRRAQPLTANPTWGPRILAAVPRDAIEEIVARARKTNIVILNEAHASPRDRAFALRVARALRPLGYKTLAAETFGNNKDETGVSPTDRLKQERVVRFDTGGYTKDPVFARFVSEALALGYEPVAYERTTAQERPGGTMADREQSQAENLMRTIFSARPKEKVLIFVGQGHVVEKPGSLGEMMAARLKRLSGVDPLTIDQAGVTEIATSQAYAVASARVGKDSAVNLEGANPLLIGYNSGVDLQVIHPRRSYRFGRPGWLADLGGKRLPIPKHLLPAKGRRLIQVFAADAPSDAVPLDQVLVTANTPAPSVFVPAGPVRFASPFSNDRPRAAIIAVLHAFKSA